MIHCSNLWVNEMTKKDLLFLKSTLAEIRHEQKSILSAKSKIRMLEQRQDLESKTLRDLNREINRIYKLSKSHEEWVSEKKREISDVKTRLKEKRSIRKERNLEIKHLGAIISEREEQIDTTEAKNTVVTMIFLVLFTLIGFSAGMIYTKDFPRGEWVCDDGTIVDLLDVDDFWDTEDCPDGSDEDFIVFGNSRAEDAGESDEFRKLSAAISNARSYCTIIGFGLGLGIRFLFFRITKSLNPNHTVESLEEDMTALIAKKEQLTKKRKSGDNIGKLDASLKQLESELSNRTDEVSGHDDLKSRKANTTNQISKNNSDLEELLKKIKLKENLIKEYWEKLSHLIPYSESIKLL